MSEELTEQSADLAKEINRMQKSMWHYEHKERENQRRRDWYAANRSDVLEKRKKYNEKNHARISIYRRDYYLRTGK